jgi:O-antigen ligase
MPFVDKISLSTLQIVFVLVGCLFSVWAARPEWAAGVYLSTSYWTRTVMFGPIAHTWVFMATMVGAAAVYKLKNPAKALLPPRDRWIVFWMGIWWGWMLVLIGLFRPPQAMPILRALILYVIAPLPILLLFAGDLRRARSFAASYVLCTMVGGWTALSVMGISIGYIRTDPALRGRAILHLGVVNYHWFAYALAICLILIVPFFQQTRRKYLHVILLLAALYCAYLLILVGARQSIVALTLMLSFFVLWVLRRRRLLTQSVVLLLALVALTGVFLYRTAPELILRHETRLIADLSYASLKRAGFWQIGWRAFVNSPIWGAGFTEYYSHNIFVGSLAEQGLIGMGFLIGFLVFFGRQIRGVWSGTGPRDESIWRMAFSCVVLFGLAHSQASGSTDSVWHLYWPCAFLWWMAPSRKPFRQHVTRSTARYRHRAALQPMYRRGKRLQ